MTKMCPFQSQVVKGDYKDTVVHVPCLEAKCALWTTQKDLITEKYVERCGLIK